MKNVNLKISGMHCAACVGRVERKLSKISGVERVNASLATNSVYIQYDENKSSKYDLIAAISTLGFKYIGDQDSNSMGLDNDNKLLKIRTIIAFICGVPVFILAMGPMLGLKIPLNNTNLYVQLILTTVVYFYCGYPFYSVAVRNLKNGVLDMSTLVFIGTTSAYIFSTVIMAFPKLLIQYHIHEPYFESVSVIIAVVLLGRLLESNAKKNVADSINRLFELKPQSALKLIDGNSTIELKVEEICEGDMLRVIPGVSIPVDGVISKGMCSVDESALTGESRPVDKKMGDKLYAGTHVLSGAVDFTAEKVGEDTILSKFIRQVEEAVYSKAPIQRLADKISGYFVQAVILIAIITFSVWYIFGAEPKLPMALISSITVLIIACPCSLGLATPSAIMAAVGRGAKEGILIKNGEILEKSGRIDVIVFDKTGTLTEGLFEVIDVVSSIDVTTLLSLVASVENLSEHPIARSITKYAISQGAIISDVTEFSSDNGGVQGVVMSKVVSLGTSRYLSGKGILVNEVDPKGGTIFYISIDNFYVGYITLGDKIRSESLGVVKELKSMGIESIMLSGDNEHVCKYVASEIGISRYYSCATPDYKRKVISDLVNEGRYTAMVGDGINDAAAIAEADIGIAMSDGTDLAISSSDITLTGGLSKLPKAIILSRKTSTIIKENLFWAFIYNILGIPIAAGVLYPFFNIILNPMIAGVAMAFSSVTVIMNALRLKRMPLDR